MSRRSTSGSGVALQIDRAHSLLINILHLSPKPRFPPLLGPNADVFASDLVIHPLTHDLPAKP